MARNGREVSGRDRKNRENISLLHTGYDGLKRAVLIHVQPVPVSGIHEPRIAVTACAIFHDGYLVCLVQGVEAIEIIPIVIDR